MSFSSELKALFEKYDVVVDVMRVYLISIVHHFSMKLYGSRSYKKHEDADSTVR